MISPYPKMSATIVLPNYCMQSCFEWTSVPRVGEIRNKKRIIILTTQRTGSTWLITLLNNYNNIQEFGEPFINETYINNVFNLNNKRLTHYKLNNKQHLYNKINNQTNKTHNR